MFKVLGFPLCEAFIVVTKKMVNQNVVTKRCIVDGRFFSIYPKRPNHHHYHGTRGIYKRPHTSLTCSKECSRRYLHNRKQYLKMLKAKK